MSENSYCYFRNEKCRYFPCHEGIDPEQFNCLFCYCPLNPVINCGGSYSLTKNGIKDCSKCIYPHKPENYPHVVKKVERMLNKSKFPENGVMI